MHDILSPGICISVSWLIIKIEIFYVFIGARVTLYNMSIHILAHFLKF